MSPGHCSVPESLGWHHDEEAAPGVLEQRGKEEGSTGELNVWPSERYTFQIGSPPQDRPFCSLRDQLGKAFARFLTSGSKDLDHFDEPASH